MGRSVLACLHAPCLTVSTAGIPDGSAQKPAYPTTGGNGGQTGAARVRWTRRSWEAPVDGGSARWTAPELLHYSLGVLAVWFHYIMYKDCFHKKLNIQSPPTGRPLLSPVSDRNCRE